MFEGIIHLLAHGEIILILQGEMKEMVELYVKKGFSEQDATDIIQIMSNHKDFFIDHMMVQVIVRE